MRNMFPSFVRLQCYCAKYFFLGHFVDKRMFEKIQYNLIRYKKNYATNEYKHKEYEILLKRHSQWLQHLCKTYLLQR